MATHQHGRAALQQARVVDANSSIFKLNDDTFSFHYRLDIVHGCFGLLSHVQRHLIALGNHLNATCHALSGMVQGRGFSQYRQPRHNPALTQLSSH